MCCGHEYEIASELGGPEKMKELMTRAQHLGVKPFSWTNNDQALSSPINRNERATEDTWFVALEDARQKYGGAYMGCMSVLDWKVEPARRYFIDTHKKIKHDTGLDRYLFDSFYNLGFMPVSYSDARPTTMWRECLEAFKELQDAGVHFRIESFGPFGAVMHGCPRSYSLDNAWVVYKVNLGNDYTTVPSGPTYEDPRAGEAAGLYYALAHMARPNIPLTDSETGLRIDAVWTDAHKRALNDYNENLHHMKRRYLQEDGQGVLWHDSEGERATLWNFADREVALPGAVTDLTTDESLPSAKTCKLKANHTYAITGTELPKKVG
jgi:hypothetical protein